MAEDIKRHAPHRGEIVHPSTDSQPATHDSDCYCTPPEIIDLVSRAFDCLIDLDPFAGNNNHAVVNYRYPEKDGLKDPWAKRTYVNPPFSGKWKHLVLTKCMEERAKGNNIILMIPSSIIGTVIGEDILYMSDAVCCLSKRVAFLRPDGTRAGSPANGSLLVFFGKDPHLRSNFIFFCSRPGTGVVLGKL